MNRLLFTSLLALACAFPAAWSQAADAASAAGQEASRELTTKAAAASTTTEKPVVVTAPDFLEHLVDSVLSVFNIHSSGNTPSHYAIGALLLVVALLARQIVTRLLFPGLQKIAARTATTLDDKMFPAIETPIAAFVMIVGIFAALNVLKLSPQADFYISSGARVAFSLAIFWLLWRVLAAVLQHGTEIAHSKHMGVAAFMPWISKTLLTVFAVLAVLLTIQSLGYDVKALLAGLGIGGLAFALAAQDTLANVFGAIVVAVDQPFRIGETVRIAGNVGAVEDIGLRSTRLRLADKSLMVIPNKTVAADAITNLSRFTRRRVEQVIGLTYNTSPQQMDELVAEIGKLIAAQPEVDAGSINVFFRDFNASSLDIWLAYEMPDPDFAASMRVRQRLNLAIMALVESRKLAFAFPTQTVHLAAGFTERLGGGEPRRDAPPPSQRN